MEDPVRLFACEFGAQGQRNFIATTYSNFWDKYCELKAEQRHHYEVVCEGLPCHLYFDLEFPTSSNPGCDGDRMVMVLVQHVMLCLATAYGVSVRPEDFVHLDSTSKTKFSRHLILRACSSTPHAAFTSNAHAGNFVRKMCLDIERDRLKKPELQILFVDPEENNGTDVKNKCHPPGEGDSKKKLFIDQGVYSRNRSFRLFLSSKWGVGKQKLRPVLSLRMPPDMAPKEQEEEPQPPASGAADAGEDTGKGLPAEPSGSAEGGSVLLHSASLAREDVASLDDRKAVEDEAQAGEGPEMQFFPFESSQAYFLASLICNVEQSSILLTCEDVTTPNVSSSVSANPRPGKERAPSSLPQSKSRFPCLDRFVASLPLLRRGGQAGYVRTCLEMESSSAAHPVLCYTIGGNRWCGNVQRAHKSNSIYLVCDLLQATVVQKCFDPDCRLFRGPGLPIPRFVLDSIATEAEDDRLILEADPLSLP